jgi:hypothetical protein
MLMRRNVRTVLCLLALSGLALAGCGSSGSNKAKDNGIASKSPTEVIEAVKVALRTAGTFHLSGSGTSSGDLFTVDVRVDSKDNKAKGTLGLNGDQLQLIVIGTAIYVNAPPSFYEGNGATKAQAALVGGKWLKSSTSNADFAEFTEFTDIDKLLTPDAEVTKGETTTVNGQPALALIDGKGTEGEGTMYVRTTGDPLPVQIKGGGKESGSLNFDDYGTPVDATAPADAVDLAQLTG